MRKQNSLQELTIKDNFMFCAVMSDELHCRDCLELVLEIPIEKVTVCQEKRIIYHPGYRGIRLDVVARDEKHTHYDVELQTAEDGSRYQSRSGNEGYVYVAMERNTEG
jgi:hypothetical protein